MRSWLKIIGFAFAAAGMLLVVLSDTDDWRAYTAGVACLGMTTRCLVAHYVIRKVTAHHGQAEDSYDLGYQMGFDKGHREGRRAGMPVVVPLNTVKKGAGNAVERGAT